MQLTVLPRPPSFGKWKRQEGGEGKEGRKKEEERVGERSDLPSKNPGYGPGYKPSFSEIVL